MEEIDSEISKEKITNEALEMFRNASDTETIIKHMKNPV